MTQLPEDLRDMQFGPVGDAAPKESEVRPHEIYQNTQYIPNKELRLLHIPLNSSITFQKLLYYHGTYNLLYAVLMMMAALHRVQTRELDWQVWVFSIVLVLWAPTEYSRRRFGYKGNINETFPELIAFQIFTVFFIVPLSVAPMVQQNLFPHERICCILNIAFIFLEFVYGAILIQNFIRTQSAVFFLRTAPIIDKNFKKKYSSAAKDMLSVREIQLGMQAYDRQRDF